MRFSTVLTAAFATLAIATPISESQSYKFPRCMINILGRVSPHTSCNIKELTNERYDNCLCHDGGFIIWMHSQMRRKCTDREIVGIIRSVHLTCEKYGVDLPPLSPLEEKELVVEDEPVVEEE
ncbi:hypothetical protein EJ08DRAFT_730026 [Tothia fuscella]|uniref:Extracellular membrane protein CFEM domain-containing protein n=1 Tax=Tothia fuscella TaxID=1048955 RepID=A0A9P4U424_9PEZI|nr:hypothetical protein EJ08DRAFT_730026 [Tothia fuscella]